MLHAVIMAGGAGTRFWPASRQDTPKQLLDLTGQRSMIQDTVGRLGDLVPPARILVVTNQRLVEPITRQLPELPAEAIIGEPCKRDTAPCIGLAAMLLSRRDPQAVMAVMPADHIIQPAQQFRRALSSAVELLVADDSRIVTFGIVPTYPAETFGYIHRGEPLEKFDGAYHVRRFREKPDAVTARGYVESAEYYWNSGIFVWKAATILDALREREPNMHEHLQAIGDAHGTPAFEETLRREFTAIQGKSIDYAIMEHYHNTIVLEAPFEWDDLGSWGALARLLQPDALGNVVVGRAVTVDASNCIIRANQRHVVTALGVRDLIIVHADDATLVAHRSDEEAVRKIVELLKARGWDEYL